LLHGSGPLFHRRCSSRYSRRAQCGNVIYSKDGGRIFVFGCVGTPLHFLFLLVCLIVNDGSVTGYFFSSLSQEKQWSDLVAVSNASEKLKADMKKSVRNVLNLTDRSISQLWPQAEHQYYVKQLQRSFTGFNIYFVISFFRASLFMNLLFFYFIIIYSHIFSFSSISFLSFSSQKHKQKKKKIVMVLFPICLCDP